MREVESDEQYFQFVNLRHFDFKMDIAYFVGGWHHTKGYEPLSNYLTVELSPFEICKNEITRTYYRNLHNLACGIAKMGTFQKV